MKNLKKIIVAASLCVAIGATAVAGTLAYFTDETDTAVNTFTSGDLKIALKEPEWKPENGQIKPGATIAKDPTVTFAADSVASYARVVVTMPAAFYNYSNLNITTDEDYGDYISFDNAAIPSSAVVADGVATLYYDYTLDAAKNGATIVKLFDSVSFSGLLSNDADNVDNEEYFTAWSDISAPTNKDIVIKAYAVQREAGKDFDTAMEVFDEFDN